MRDARGTLPTEGLYYWGDSAVAVVFSVEQAACAFMNLPPTIPVLCIDVPRANLHFSLQDAARFYERVDERIIPPDDKAIEAALQAFWDTETEGSGLDDMRRAIAAYEAALWQPIESAPRDGTVIDLWVPEWFLDSPQRVTDCSWRSARVPFSGRIAEGWFKPNDEFGSEDVWLPDDPDNQPGPTHWRHLPAPPKD